MRSPAVRQIISETCNFSALPSRIHFTGFSLSGSGFRDQDRIMVSSILNRVNALSACGWWAGMRISSPPAK